MKKKAIKRALVVFMVLCLLAAPIMRAKAIATGATVVAAVCLAALAGWGVVTVCNGMTAQDVDAWAVEELGLWASQNNSTVGQLIPDNGITLDPYGNFVLDPAASMGVALFNEWLVNKYGLSDGGATVPVVEPGVTINGYTMYKHVQWKRRRYPDTIVGIQCEGDCAAMITNVGEDGYTRVVVIRCGTNGSAYYDGSSSNISFTRYGTTNCYYYSQTLANSGETLLWSNVPLTSYSKAQIMNGTGGYASQEGSLELAPDTNITIPDTSQPAQDTNISWGGSTGLTVQQAADMIMEKVATNTLTVVVSDTAQDNPTTGWPDVTSPVSVQGLDEIFPFCIPFDIYAILTSLSAERETPHFEIPFIIPMLDFEQTIVLDFGIFENIATLVRTLELMGFIIGLAVVTRSLFLRG